MQDETHLEKLYVRRFASHRRLPVPSQLGALDDRIASVTAVDALGPGGGYNPTRAMRARRGGQRGLPGGSGAVSMALARKVQWPERVAGGERETDLGAWTAAAPRRLSCGLIGAWS